MKTFELKKEHLELLKHVVWRKSGYEYDAPEIDSKRPFFGLKKRPNVWK